MKNKHECYRLRDCSKKNSKGEFVYQNCNLCCEKKCKKSCINGRVPRKNNENQYVDVCYSSIDFSGNIVRQEPIPKVKSLVVKREIVSRPIRNKDGLKTYKRRPYSYSVTELIRNEKKSYREQEKMEGYMVNCECCDPNSKEIFEKYKMCKCNILTIKEGNANRNN